MRKLVSLPGNQVPCARNRFCSTLVTIPDRSNNNQPASYDETNWNHVFLILEVNGHPSLYSSSFLFLGIRDKWKVGAFTRFWTFRMFAVRTTLFSAMSFQIVFKTIVTFWGAKNKQNCFSKWARGCSLFWTEIPLYILKVSVKLD